MIYRIKQADPCYLCSAHHEPETRLPGRWEVEKALNGGESYVMASFEDKGHAIAMLTLVAGSLEAGSGAKIEFDGWST